MAQKPSYQLEATRGVLFGMARMLTIALPMAAGWAQSTPPAKPQEFEVATVKASAPDARGTMINIQPGGVLTVKNAPLKQLITMCYDLREFQVSGGPGWLGTDHYDVEAKSEAVANPPDPRSMTDAQRTEMQNQLKERMRSLLAERFQLTARREMKEMPIYALVQAKGGSKLQPSKPEPGGNQGMRMQRGMMTGMSASVEMLANSMANLTGRPVVDKTGLQGKFDWKLEWTPETAPAQPGMTSDKQAAANPPDLSGPSLFTALQEQLGLKLESQKGPAPVLIIDRVEKPSAN